MARGIVSAARAFTDPNARPAIGDGAAVGATAGTDNAGTASALPSVTFVLPPIVAVLASPVAPAPALAAFISSLAVARNGVPRANGAFLREVGINSGRVDADSADADRVDADGVDADGETIAEGAAVRDSVDSFVESEIRLAMLARSLPRSFTSN